ncbi:MAG: chorismate-binding protein [Halobacteriovoraceae bacterium]|jgi:para-aminobenzoate synthetase component I|nr:chorismate-binding protein [Halobacteriovoraceae bacterium]MBT5093089.1 chorismate-binding protein [Halobacteriovoraceae bacterium]
MENLSNIFSLFNLGDNFIKLHSPRTAFAFYPGHKLNLLTEKKEPFSAAELLRHFDSIDLENDLRVTHLTYELGSQFYNFPLDPDCLLAIDIEYTEEEPYLIEPFYQEGYVSSLESPSYDRYQRAFNKGYHELVEGNCYQFNLTFQTNLGLGGKWDAEQLAACLWEDPKRRSAYAHLTYLPIWNKTLLSNSPECLFQMQQSQKDIEKWNLWAMPIKGTWPLEEQLTLQELEEDHKNRGELDMITDLLRNDLNKIDIPCAKVIVRRDLLKVPGLLHQYSLVALKLSKKVSLSKIISAIFPGGSITGAPKKNVIKILRELENRERRFYCGSTLLTRGGRLAASINIRTAEVDLERFSLNYQSGGGITLLSQVDDEFDEMQAKSESFLQPFLKLLPGGPRQFRPQNSHSNLYFS